MIESPRATRKGSWLTNASPCRIAWPEAELLRLARVEEGGAELLEGQLLEQVGPWRLS